jgi:hypothetical protein
MDLGRQLSRARETETFVELYHDFGISKRAAYYLALIADAVDDNRFAEADVEDIGWTKSRVIIEFDLAAKHRRSAVAYARQHSVPELQDWLKTGRITRQVPRLFYLSETQVKLLDEALIGMGARQVQSGLVGRTRALMALVRLAGRKSQENQGVVPDKAVATRAGRGRKRGTDRREKAAAVGLTAGQQQFSF